VVVLILAALVLAAPLCAYPQRADACRVPAHIRATLHGWDLYRWSVQRERVRMLSKGWRAWSVREALTCIRRESGGNQYARNPYSGAAGLFQLMPGFWAGRYNPYRIAVNVHIAADLYARRGWQPWVTMP